MKLEFNKKYTTIAIYAFFVLAAAVLFGIAVNKIDIFYRTCATIAQLLIPFIYAFGIAYIMNPVLKWVEERMLRKVPLSKYKRGVSILISYLFATGLLTIFLLIVLPRLIESVSGLIAQVVTFVNSADWWTAKLLELFPDTDLNQTLFKYFQDSAATLLQGLYSMLSQLLPWLTNFSARMASGLLNVLVGIIISFYMLSSKEQFCAGSKRMVYAALPHEKANWLLELAADANRIFGGFISGKILDSVIIGILCFGGLKLLGIPNALLVSVIVGVTNVIPYFGPFIGAIPSFFIILIENPFKSLVFLAFVLILQQFDGNILGPKILGDSTGLSAFWVIFAIMLFGGIWGFPGMFLGVPVFSVLYMLIGRIINTFLRKRGMPLDMASYCAPDAPIPSGKPIDTPSKQRRGAHTVQKLENPPDNRQEK